MQITRPGLTYCGLGTPDPLPVHNVQILTKGQLGYPTRQRMTDCSISSLFEEISGMVALAEIRRNRSYWHPEKLPLAH